MSALVQVPGASCRPGPSPTSRALRLDGLRARDGAALAALLERLPDPPWEVEVDPEDELAGMLSAAGFDDRLVIEVMARPVSGLPSSFGVRGVDVVPYRNEWEEAYAAGEAMAMEGHPFLERMGQPTGYEASEGFDSAIAARTSTELVGFAQAQLPEGWINWLWVVPARRREGVGHALVAELARQVKEARGTHLAAAVPAGTDAVPFLAALGFKARGRRLLLGRAGATAD
jgi:GNAT superfamily N-acetyltransferase